MIEQLFGSKTRVKLLKMFYSNPNRSFYVREITRKIDEQINSVRRELSNLLSIGIIASDNSNNRLYYEVNKDYRYYKPLLEIFGGGEVIEGENGDETDAASAGPVVLPDPDLSELIRIGNVDIALYTGQFTRDERSGIDMLIIGDVNHTRTQKFIAALEAKEKKEIRYVVMSVHDFDYRRQIKDRFIVNVLASKKQVLVDKRGIIEEE